MHPLLGISRGDHTTADTLIAQALAAADGGLRALLVREPDLPHRELEKAVRALSPRLDDLVLHLKTPGAASLSQEAGLALHLPSTEDVASWCSVRGLIGCSTHSVQAASAALEAGATYAFLSPVFTPTSKPADTRVCLGVDGLRPVSGAAVWALGGITPRNLGSVLGAGVAGVAVQGGLFGSTAIVEIRAAARRYVAGLVAIP